MNIQYIQDIKKNEFKLENILKLSTSVRSTKKTVRSLRISISKLEINIKATISPDFSCICTNSYLVNKLQFQLALTKYIMYFIILWKIYT